MHRKEGLTVTSARQSKGCSKQLHSYNLESWALTLRLATCNHRTPLHHKETAISASTSVHPSGTCYLQPIHTIAPQGNSHKRIYLQYTPLAHTTCNHRTPLHHKETAISASTSVHPSDTCYLQPIHPGNN